MGAGAPKAGEELISFGYVLGDLGAEFLGAAELFFLAETLPEMDLDAARRDFGERL